VDPVSKKKKLVIALLALALILPLFMISSWGLGILESIALNHAPAEWAASLDLRVADFYGMTLRSDNQKEVCEKFLATFPSHPRTWYAKYSIATCIERDLDASRPAARRAYEDFLNEYGYVPEWNVPEEYVEKARKAVARLKG